MSRVRRRRVAGLLAAVLIALAAPCMAQGVPEPASYRMDAYREAVPATLSGARVVSTAEAEAMWRDGAAFVDVLPAPPRPENLPEGTIWRTPGHPTIPGATWLPNTGFGALPSEMSEYFRAGLAETRDAMPGRPLVLFCKRNCWMSWNAAKRAIADGETDVVWFPDGADGWLEAGLPVEDAMPRPGFR